MDLIHTQVFEPVLHICEFIKKGWNFCSSSI